MSETCDRLLESAQFFACEAVKNALEARSVDQKKWNLAALHVVTGFEHAAKALLAKQHAVLIRTKIDGSDQSTVSLEEAFKRLSDKSIYSLTVSDRDKQRISRAVKMRNTIAHGGRIEHPQALEASFFEVFAYLRDFFWIHLSIRLLDTFPVQLRDEVERVEKQVSAILQRVDANVKGHDQIWICSQCFSKHMVKGENCFHCYYCLHEDPIFQCERCQKELPEHEAFETEELFEWNFANDPPTLVENFEIGEHKVCQSCFEELSGYVTEKIKEHMILDATVY